MTDAVADSSFGPCDHWATTDECRANSTLPDTEKIDQDLLEMMRDIAEETLYVWSGKQFSGLCEDTVRPVMVHSCSFNAEFFEFMNFDDGNGNYGFPSVPFRNDLFNFNQYDCDGVSRVSLGGYPVVQIEEVKLNGNVLDSSLYGIQDARWLYGKQNGASRQTWPCIQNLTADADQDGTFQVKFKYGKNPPTLGKHAIYELTDELVRAKIDPSNSRLDRRVTNQTRQGTAIVYPGLQDVLKDDRFGLPICDLFIKTYNPNRLSRRARVSTPDMRNKVRRNA